TSSRSSLSLAKQGSTFVFDGSLDAAAGTSKNYTAQADWHFVYEKDSNWYIDVGSNAEVWLYIDGMLVIDGGGVGGVKFDITNGTVVTQEPCDASVTIVGAAIGSGSVNWPVTTRVKVGSSTIDPFGSFTSSTAGNVNDNKNPRTASLGSNIAAGTSISVLGQSWEPTGKTASSHMIVDSGAGSKNVKVLRNGDTCPNIAGFGNQASASTFLAPYIDPTSKKITIQPNQIIYLYELYTTDYSSAAADFQDLVVLVTLNRPAVTTTTTSTTTTYSAAPSMSQRIDLSRIPWLEDHSDHQITLFFANRTGAASNLRIETNISTLNLANYRTAMQQD
ncbi:MAG TPA: hypothetical protein VHC70_08640, partial [Phycisphaerales bacterium]|nr:hypothetical protein [Phycisphaerales bacterium]